MWQIRRTGDVTFCRLKFANGEGMDYFTPISGFNWNQEIVFDLSGDDAVIKETHIGQELTPSLAPPAAKEGDDVPDKLRGWWNRRRRVAFHDPQARADDRPAAFL